MDKPMRRSDRQLTDEETLQLFRDAEYGVLSVTDENNMPYGVPMSFALSDIIALGYAADTPDSPKRKGVDKLLRYI